MVSVICVLCLSNEGEMNVVGAKGLKTILLRACLEKKKDDTYEHLMRLKKDTPIYVHNDCRLSKETSSRGEKT